MQDNISPEERLLNLIRKGSKKSSQKTKKIVQKLETSPQKLVVQKVSSANKRSRKKILLSGFFNLTKIKERLSVVLTNRSLIVTILIFGIYLIIEFIFNSPGKIEEQVLALKEVKEQRLEVSHTPAEALQPVSYYSKAVQLRNIFTAPGPQTQQAPASPTFMEMVSKLSLQGIISGANPQAIIEDATTKQVYFISPGERIGEIELKEILPGKVKLNYRGQEAELSL